MDLVVALAGFGLLAVSTIALTAALQIRGRATFLVAAFVLACGQVVLLLELLSLADAFTRRWVLVGQLLFAAGALALWAGRGRPLPPPPGRPSRPWLAEARRAHPVTVVAVALAGFAWLFQLVVGLTSVPNNGDSMMYHLSRAAHWIQNESAFQIPGGSIWQNGYAPDGELLMAWTMVLLDGDRLAFVVQWASWGGLVLAIFSGCRLMGFGPAPAAFAAAITGTLPIVIIEATTTQTEVVTSCFLAATAVFGARGLRDGNWGDLLVGGAAYGLAFGTKGTAVLAAPWICLLLAGVLRRYRPSRRTLVAAGVSAIAGVTLLGAFNYILNLDETGKINGGAPDHLKRTGNILENELRVFWGAIETPGYRAEWLQRAEREVGRAIGGKDMEYTFFSFEGDTGVDDTATAFGPLGWALIIPLFVLFVLRGPPPVRLAAGAGLGFILTYGYLVGFTPFTTRLLMPAFVLGAPVLAAIAHRRWLPALVVAVAALTLVPVLLTNPYKRILVTVDGEQPYWEQSRLRQQVTARGEIMENVYRDAAGALPNAQAVGYIGPEGSWDYPLFGPGFERRVERLGADPDAITLEMMEAADVKAVFVSEVQKRPRLRPGLETFLIGEEPPVFGSPTGRQYWLVYPAGTR